MGEVYLARDERLERDVAIKLLRERFDTPEARDRFLREARAAANLVHPQIVTIFDYGEEGDALYIAMEHVAGETLDQTIRRRKPLSLGTKLHLMEGLCGGLGYAHRRNVIHRDIKPANLMLLPDGTLKILDFGIARVGTSTATPGQSLLGSLNYMSPEQLAMQPLDHRSDIFAVGAVFYELLSYQRAFSGASIEEVIERIRSGRYKPLDVVCPELPAAIVAIVTRALAPAPAQRFQDLGDMARKIERVRRTTLGLEDGVQTVAEGHDTDETIAVDSDPPRGSGAGRHEPLISPPVPSGRLGTDRDLLLQRRANEIAARLEAARAAFERGDSGAARDHCEAVLVLDPENAAAGELLDRAAAPAQAIGTDPPFDSGVPPAVGWLATVQSRLLDRRRRRDYLYLALLGTLPLLIAWQTGALHDSQVLRGSRLAALCEAPGAERTISGYGSRPNWWPLFIMMPVVLLFVRVTAAQLFPLSAADEARPKGLLLRIAAHHQQPVVQRLARAARDPRNLLGVLILGVIINIIDVREVASFYIAALQGQPLAHCPRELDWSVQFLAGSDPGLWTNMALVTAAYSCQFTIHSLSMMGYGLLLRYNLFYLGAIYLRHRAERRPQGQYIVLDFDDVERCFGLRVMHGTFNLQVAILIIGGLLIIGSRVANVDPNPVSEQYQHWLAVLLLRDTASQRVFTPVGFADLFPDVGQIMLGAAWVTCFAIVALPSFVKFLPLIYKRGVVAVLIVEAALDFFPSARDRFAGGGDVKIVGRREYLMEFLPPSRTPRLDTTEQVDALAAKFARSAFWPAGDDRARILYVIAYFIFFFVLVPMPPGQGIYLLAHASVLLVAAVLSTKMTFWALRRILVAIDASLAQV